MKILSLTWVPALMFTATGVGVCASAPPVPAQPAQFVFTALPGPNAEKATLEPGELSVTQNGKTAPVLRLEQLTADRARMQLFILLDDSSRSSSLGVQIPELKSFIGALPATTEVAVGYMHNGTFSVAQAFTADHQQAAKAVRLPVGIPGENGSPYFALSSLVKHWPSSETAGRRAVVMLTDGVDRYFTSTMVNDPYVDAAAHDAVRHGIMVYSIYLRGAGIYGRGGWATNVAQIAADAGER